MLSHMQAVAVPSFQVPSRVEKEKGEKEKRREREERGIDFTE